MPVVLVTLLGLTACDFFRELESLPEAGDDESGSGDDTLGDTLGDTGAGETEGEPCIVYDNTCSGQDMLHACSPETLELVPVSCSAWCAGLVNFTCAPNETEVGFPHGCWCVEPGQVKIDSCTQLETCVVECGSDPNSACTQDCFTRTDTSTVRLLGALYSCADLACDQLCVDSPGECATCLIAARAGAYGDCSLAREVCNDDRNDEPSWP